jgi:hypothetical protein
VIAFALTEMLSMVWGPGLVFLVFIIWLIRRVIRAARTESQLEEERLREWMKGEVDQLQSSKAEPRLMRVPPAAERRKALALRDRPAVPSAVPGTESLISFPEPGADAPASGAFDRTGVTEAELELVRPLFGSDIAAAAPPRVLWVRSTVSHIVFCERLDAQPSPAAPRDVITVVKVADGAVVGKWQFG